MSRIALTIDGRSVTVRDGATIMAAARLAGIDVPRLCAPKDGFRCGDDVRTVCRLCLVTIEGTARPVTSCSTPALANMTVHTTTPELRAKRRLIMELVVAEQGGHLHPGSEVAALAAELGCGESRFSLPSEGARRPPSDVGSDHLIVDPRACVHCDRCIRACSERRVIARHGRGAQVRLSFDDHRTLARSACVDCGDCMAACPSGGIRLRQGWR